MEAMTYTRTAADPTKYLFNAGAEKNDLTGYYETFYRNYDASIGRFTGVDIMAAKYSSLTPYQYAFNDHVFWNDPLGDDPENGCGCPQESWDYRMDWGGAMSFDQMERSLSGLFAGATPWSINSGSLFTRTGVGSGNHWADHYRSVGGNMVTMRSSTFNDFYRVDHMTGSQKARFGGYLSQLRPPSAEEMRKMGYQLGQLFGRHFSFESGSYSLVDVTTYGFSLGIRSAIRQVQQRMTTMACTSCVEMASSASRSISQLNGGIENTFAAVVHYLIGDGSPQAIGAKTTRLLMNTQTFRNAHNDILRGNRGLSGRFRVDMTDLVFHIGRTPVSYKANIKNQTITYTFYQGDGFWDPDFMDERYGNNSVFDLPPEIFFDTSKFTTDGMGPNLERLGGTPYEYIPTTITIPMTLSIFPFR